MQSKPRLSDEDLRPHGVLQMSNRDGKHAQAKRRPFWEMEPKWMRKHMRRLLRRAVRRLLERGRPESIERERKSRGREAW